MHMCDSCCASQAVGGVTQLSCGADHLAAIDGAGRLWVWGGRFGETPARVDLPGATARTRGAAGGEGGEGGEAGEAGESGVGVALVACGAECMLAVSGLGECFVWGNGELSFPDPSLEPEPHPHPHPHPYPHPYPAPLRRARPAWVGRQ